jgi:hypothetical protein
MFVRTACLYLDHQAFVAILQHIEFKDFYSMDGMKSLDLVT